MSTLSEIEQRLSNFPDLIREGSVWYHTPENTEVKYSALCTLSANWNAEHTKAMHDFIDNASGDVGYLLDIVKELQDGNTSR